VTLKLCVAVPSWMMAPLIDPLAEVAYSEAVKVAPDFEVGEELYEEVNILDFGRRAILAAKQTLASRISDLKKNVLVKKYGDRVGDIISAEVYQVWKKEILLLDEESNELILPKSEQIPAGLLQKGRKHPCRGEESRAEEQLSGDHPVPYLSFLPGQTAGN
jgi:hypothetical protein